MGAPKKAAAAKAAADAPAAPEETDATGAPELLQFPSDAGQPEVEIAERSADVDDREASEHRKVFVIPRNDLVTQDYDDEIHAELHRANIDAMRQAMVLQGLRPTEDGRFVRAQNHSDGQSVCLTYACACVPAHVATPEQNVVAITVDDQHALEEKTRG